MAEANQAEVRDNSRPADLKKLEGKTVVSGKPEFKSLVKAVITKAELRQGNEFKSDDKTGEKFNTLYVQIDFKVKGEDGEFEFSDTFGGVKQYESGRLYAGPKCGYSVLAQAVKDNFPDFNGEIAAICDYLMATEVKIKTEVKTVGENEYKKTVIGSFL